MFPDFNIYSTPLLILVLQGLLLVMMLLNKAWLKKDISSLLLALLLLVTCYHRTTYTIGFMGWYDTFRNTKINYYLIQLTLGIGPLIYLYIKSVGEKGFQIKGKVWLHFAPMMLYILFCIGLILYDRQQPNFDDTQNGVGMQWALEHISSLIAILFSVHLLLYLIFSFQLYYKIRSRLEHQFTDTYKFEMRWLRNFLFLFAFLFTYNTLQQITEDFIFELHWTQEWWFQFFSLLVVLYVGIKGFFTPLEDLPLMEFEMLHSQQKITQKTNDAVKGNSEDLSITRSIDIQKQVKMVSGIVEKEALYLNSNITLTILAQRLKMPPSQLSMVINTGLGKNFNEFINGYRVAQVKQKIEDKDYQHLSILAIALDTGFNSKATFNRVFKKIDGNPPSAYRK